MEEDTSAVNQGRADVLSGKASSVRKQSAMERILATGVIKPSHLPMLDTVFEHFAQSVGTALRSRMGVGFEVSVGGISDVRMGQFLEGVAVPSLTGVFRAREWDGHGVVVFGPSLVRSMIDIALGGRGPDRHGVDKRTFTAIERNIVQDVLQLLLLELSASFQPLCDVGFSLERIETETQAALIASARSTAVSASLRLSGSGASNQLDIVLPHATLEPVHDLLSQHFMGEKLGRDTAWRRHLHQELLKTEIDLVAVLCEREMALSEFTRLKVGDRLDLRMMSGDPVVTMRCDGKAVITGRLGHRNDLVAVQVESSDAAPGC